MTTPKVPTIKRGGSRFYVDPESGSKVPGVTSVLNMLPKEFLKFWAAKLVAEVAVDQAPNWIGLAMNGDREGAIDYLKRAPMRDTGKAAQRGTEAHDIFEKLSLGEPLGRIAPDMAWAVQHYEEFLRTFEPEFLYLEGTVWNDTPPYAGSFDWIARIGDEVIIGDNKTTRSGVHAEVALQLNAYASAEFLMTPDGERAAMPEIDGAAVLHVVPEGWKLVPVAYEPELLMPIFNGLLRVFEWERDLKKKVIGEALSVNEAQEVGDE